MVLNPLERLRLWLRSRAVGRPLTERASSDGGAEPPTGLVPLGLRLCRIGTMPTGDFIEGGPWPAVVAGFRWATVAPAPDTYVSAGVTFRDATMGEQILEPIRGSWLDHHYNHARFAPGHKHDLLLAFDNGGGLMTADDRRERNSSYGRLTTVDLHGGRVDVSVLLVRDQGTASSAQYQFEWTPAGGFVLKSGA